MVRITKNDKERSRTKLIVTAADHFSRNGFAGANVNDIAVEAGFAKGTIYNYFDSKDALFAEVLAEACRRTTDRYTATDHVDDTRENLLALARADLIELRESEAFFQVLIRETMSFRQETYPILVANLSPILVLLSEILMRGQERGDVRGDKPAPQLALIFVGLLSLLYVQHWGSGGTWPALDDIPELVVDFFLGGATTREKPGDSCEA